MALNNTTGTSVAGRISLARRLVESGWHPTSTPRNRGAVDAVVRAVVGQTRRRDGLTGRSRPLAAAALPDPSQSRTHLSRSTRRPELPLSLFTLI
jgi:hypothetical protein